MNLPENFINMINNLAAPQLAGLPDTLSSTPPSVAIRWNSLKTAAPPDGRPVAWWPRLGRYVERKESFTFMPAMHQGLFYVQDPSSMFIGHAVKTVVQRFFSGDGSQPLAYFDACAAPGGKTTCAIESLPPQSVVVANEMNPLRAAVLAEVVAKHGSPNVIVTRCDASRLGALLPETFDIVSVDAPCSGEGMMRKEPVAVTQWSPQLVEECARLQQEILDGVWQSLKPGGIMIYSTCTFNTTENELQLRRMVDLHGAEPIDLNPLPEWQIDSEVTGSIPCCRFIPGHIEGEGLFMAALRKPASSDTPRRKAPKSKKERMGPRNNAKELRQAVETASAWLSQAGDFTFSIDENGTLQAFPTAHLWLLDRVKTATVPLSGGIEVARSKGRSFIPTQQLALSTALNKAAFASADTDTETAIAYLRREAITLPSGTPRGIVLLTHGGHPLGFVNNLGSRANNLYPQAWRIVSASPKTNQS